jgi:hypothetical protein
VPYVNYFARHMARSEMSLDRQQLVRAPTRSCSRELLVFPPQTMHAAAAACMGLFNSRPLNCDVLPPSLPPSLRCRIQFSRRRRYKGYVMGVGHQLLLSLPHTCRISRRAGGGSSGGALYFGTYRLNVRLTFDCTMQQHDTTLC